MSRPRRATARSVLATLFLCGCGGGQAGLVSPQDLVAQAPADDAADEAGRFVRGLLDQLGRETCAVRVVVATRTVLFDETTEARISELADLAHEMCRSGVHVAEAGFDELGRAELSLGPLGRALGDQVAFATSDAEPWSFDGRPWARSGRSTCGGTLPAEPDYRIRLVDRGLLIVQADSDDVFPVAVDATDGDEICPSRADSDPGGVVWLSGPGEWDIYIAAVGDARPDWSASVAQPAGATGGERALAQGGRIDRELTVGPHRQSAWDVWDCAGYVPDAPTEVFWALSPGALSIEVHSNSDPVLVVVGPDGQVLCNDDTNGLDPAVYTQTTDGRWEVFVGSYGMNSTFDATLSVTLER